MVNYKEPPTVVAAGGECHDAGDAAPGSMSEPILQYPQNMRCDKERSQENAQEPHRVAALGSCADTKNLIATNHEVLNVRRIICT